MKAMIVGGGDSGGGGVDSIESIVNRTVIAVRASHDGVILPRSNKRKNRTRRNGRPNGKREREREVKSK